MCLKIQYQDLYFNIKFYRLRFWKKKHVINGMYNVECTLFNVHQPLKSQTARGHFLSASKVERNQRSWIASAVSIIPRSLSLWPCRAIATPRSRTPRCH